MTIYIIETVLFMIAAIGALLIGFEMLSNGITMIFHIMVVGFVNTGIMNLFQATSMIMGANIGTTITAQIASLSGGSGFDFGAMALGLTGIGALITMFTKNEKVKSIGNLLAGLGLLFLGLECMSISIGSTYNGKPVIKDGIKSILASPFVSKGFFAPFVLFILGIGLTALTQSSSLITSIIITFVANGIFIGAGQDATSLNNNVLFLILGSNIGSCVTALISSMGASKNAKRASIIHILFNTAGSILFMIILLLIPNLMEKTLVKWFASPGTQIAMFHTFFNVLCTLIFLPFIKVFVKLSEIIIPDRKGSEIAKTFMDERILKTPSIAISQVMKETVRLGEMSYNALAISIDGFVNKSLKDEKKIYDLIEELDILNKEIIGYLVKLSSLVETQEEEKIISNLHHSLGDFLRQAEIADNIVKYTKVEIRDSLEFSQKVYDAINLMKEKLGELFNKTKHMFLSLDYSEIDNIDILEDEIDNMRTYLINDHIKRLEEGSCKPQNSNIYINLISNLERAGDHLTYIAHALADK